MDFSDLSPDDAPTFDDILAAEKRLKGIVVETPLLESPLLNDRIGGRILVKPECLQRTGSFKFRGANNRIRALEPGAYPGGVVAHSSGNHAQGVAAAARAAGLPAAIVMPSDAPKLKLDNTRAWGAEVILYDRFTQDRSAISTAEAKKRNAALVRPFDDPYVIAGQGTIGLEIDRQLTAIDATPDQVVCCCGGGGLISGLALAHKTLRPDVPIYAAEPNDFDDTKRSLESGERQQVDPDARSICDAILTPKPGIITFALNNELLSGGVTVSDEDALDAMAVAFRDLKLVVEPGGAVALAAALTGKVPVANRTTVVVISGGNVDPEMLSRALARLGN